MPHRNDMTHWNHIGCQRGCETHATRPVRIDLSKPHGYGDLTPIPSRFGIQFDLDIWDTSITPVDGGPYCPARDAVSETILSHGIWEPQETAVMMMCFEALPGGLFIDIGSQLGWFSAIATMQGMTVIALDADPDCVDLTNRNLVHNVPMLGSIGAYNERLGPDVAPFVVDEYPDLPTVVKIDVEGAEVDAIRKIQPLIDDGWVKYMLIEISPVFNDTYEELINRLVKQEFVPYMLPPKRTPPVVLERLYPDLHSYELPHHPRDIARYIEGLHQADLFFALDGL